MADQRTYIRVHDGMPDHPKVLPLSDKAFRLLVETWAWCSHHLTDGLVTAAVWSKRSTPAARKQLIAAGLAEVLDNGDIQMHDYLEHQRSAADVEEIRRKKREAGQKGGRARAANQADAKQMLKRLAGTGQANGQAKSNTETETYTEPPPPSPPPAPDPSPTAEARKAEEEGEDRLGELALRALVDEVRAIRPGWSSASIRKALTHPDVAERPWPLIAAASLAMAKDPASQHPGRLAHDGPWWQHATQAGRPAAPPQCPDCNPFRRLEDAHGNDLGPCPTCHPSTTQDVDP